MLDSYLQFEVVTSKDIDSYIVLYADKIIEPVSAIVVYKNYGSYFTEEFSCEVKDTMLSISDVEDITGLLKFLTMSERVYFIRELTEIEADALITGNISLAEYETTIKEYDK